MLASNGGSCARSGDGRACKPRPTAMRTITQISAPKTVANAVRIVWLLPPYKELERFIHDELR